MRFKKVSFEGEFSVTYNDLNIDYWGGLSGDMVLKNDGFYIKGRRIPIRKSLWGSFENEFIMDINSSSNNCILKFLITPGGGYMVKHCVDSFTSFMDRLVNLGFDNSQWKNPCLGEDK